MDIINRLVLLLEKYAFLLVVLVAGALYWKFFGKSKVEEEEAAAEQAAHSNKLAAPVLKKVPATATKTQAKAIVKADQKAAADHQLAVYAETMHTATDHWNFQLPSTRLATIQRLGKKMEKYKLSLSGVAAEYKKAGYGDMIADIKSIIGTAEYVKWIGYAGKTK